MHSSNMVKHKPFLSSQEFLTFLFLFFPCLLHPFGFQSQENNMIKQKKILLIPFQREVVLALHKISTL